VTSGLTHRIWTNRAGMNRTVPDCLRLQFPSVNILMCYKMWASGLTKTFLHSPVFIGILKQGQMPVCRKL
jgi:hypothetical protein